MGLKELEKDVTKVLGANTMPGADGFVDDADEEEEEDALSSEDRGDDFAGGEDDDNGPEKEQAEAEEAPEAGEAEEIEGDAEADTEAEAEEEEAPAEEEADKDDVDATIDADGEGDGEPATEDENADTQEDEARRKRDRDIKVPKYVMDKKARKAREEGARADAAEREVVRLQAELDKEKTQETVVKDQAEYSETILSLSKKHAELILEGDIDGAAHVQNEQLALVRKNALEEANQTATQSSREQLDHNAALQDLNRTADAIVEQFSVLDSQSKDFDKELADEIVELRDFYVQRKGYTLSSALQSATDKLLPSAYPEYFESDNADAVDDEPEKRAVANKERAKKAISKKIAASKQPAKLEGNPNKVSAGDVRLEDLTEAAFDNLTEAQLEKLRGDTF